MWRIVEITNDLFSSHFSAYITVNDNEFAFDGRSFGRLNRFNWSNIINKDTPMMWSSKDIDSGNDYRNTLHHILHNIHIAWRACSVS